MIVLIGGVAIFKGRKSDRLIRRRTSLLTHWGNCCIWFLPFVGRPFLTNLALHGRKVATRARDHSWNEGSLYKFYSSLLARSGSGQEKSFGSLFSQRLLLGVVAARILLA